MGMSYYLFCIVQNITYLRVNEYNMYMAIHSNGNLMDWYHSFGFTLSGDGSYSGQKECVQESL